jgi:hypothetical protein
MDGEKGMNDEPQKRIETEGRTGILTIFIPEIYEIFDESVIHSTKIIDGEGV